jgi:hypothetical protein
VSVRAPRTLTLTTHKAHANRTQTLRVLSISKMRH